MKCKECMHGCNAQDVIGLSNIKVYETYMVHEKIRILHNILHGASIIQNE